MDLDIFEDEQRMYDDAVARVKAVRAGATFEFEEYAIITKEYGRILKQLRRSTRIADRTAFGLHESNLDLTDKIHFDALTGIYNRRFMEDSLKRIIRSLARSGSTLGLMMIDVDFFKKYNDTYGHSDGDECLKAVAKSISESLHRADDFAARYGGEEFSVILPDTDESGARVMANKILKDIAALGIPHEQNEATGYVTVSIGVTTSSVERQHLGSDYIKIADKALYLSKRSGRNRYTYIDFEEAER